MNENSQQNELAKKVKEMKISKSMKTCITESLRHPTVHTVASKRRAYLYQRTLALASLALMARKAANEAVPPPTSR